MFIGVLANILLSMFGALANRWRGGGFFPNGPRPLSQIIVGLPYIAGPLLFLPLVWRDSYFHQSGSFYDTIFLPGIVINLIVFGYLLMVGLTIAAECTGHGGWQDLGTWDRPRKDEALEFLIKRFKNRLPPYWYDFLGLTVSGLAISLPSGLYITAIGAFFAPKLIAYGIIVGLSGVTKALAYAFGWSELGKLKNVKPTEVGELATGYFMWDVSCAVFLAYMNF